MARFLSSVPLLGSVIGGIAMLTAPLGAVAFRADDWLVDVVVAADRPTVSLGEPAWLSFTVTNLTDEPLQILVGGDYQNELGRPASFVVRAIGKDGKWVDVPDAGTGQGGLIGPKDLPPGGRYVFRLFMPHWATFTEAGNYTIVCRRNLQLLRPAPDGVFTRQPIRDVSVEVSAPLTVLPRDDARLKQRIAELGEQMLAAAGEKPGDEAVIGLSWIEDPRVVPYFVRMLAMRSYALKFVAVQKLARFSTDEAFAGLKAAVATKPADFGPADAEQSAGLAAKIRVAAVGALSRSGHPQARALVLEQRRDSAENVRLAVVLASARMPLAQALPTLEELAKDRSAEVRASAQRYLEALRTPAMPAKTK